MIDPLSNLPLDDEYRAQFFMRTGREPKWVPTDYKRIDKEYRRVWSLNRHRGSAHR